jgi:hypothetical protein
MRRNGIATLLSGTALSASVLLILVGCSLLPQQSSGSSRVDDEDDDDDKDTSESVELSARDLDDFFDVDDAPSAFDLTLDYSSTDSADRVDEVEGYWDDVSGSENDCFDSYAASFLVGDDDDGDEYVALAANETDSASSYASIDGRVFDDEDAAADYFDTVREAAETCSDAGGYELFDDEGETIWQVSGVSAEDADGLDLPDGVSAIYQEEDVDRDYAEGYRVIMLQRGNVVIGITIQPAEDDNFSFDDGDELAEMIAEQLADLE